MTWSSTHTARTAAALLLLTLLAAVLVALDVPGPLRLVASLAFLLAAPGWAVVALLPVSLSTALEWSVATALSITLTIGLATIMLLTGWWYPVPVFFGLAVTTAALLAVQLVSLNAGSKLAGVSAQASP